MTLILSFSGIKAGQCRFQSIGCLYSEGILAGFKGGLYFLITQITDQIPMKFVLFSIFIFEQMCYDKNTQNNERTLYFGI